MDPITEKSKEGTITVKFTDSTINEEDPTEIQALNYFGTANSCFWLFW